MKACSAWRDELAAAASLSETPDPAVAAHLRECAHCRQAYSTLRQVAAAHLVNAFTLPAPKKSARLESWFRSQIREQDRPKGSMRWITVTAGFAIVVLAMVGFPTGKKEIARESKSSSEIVNSEVSYSHANARTWQSFRREALVEERLAEALPPESAAEMTHYRLKDSHFVGQ